MINKNVNSRSRIILFIIFLQIIFISNLSAQWNFSLSTVQEFNSNPFRSVNSYSDFISTYNFGIEKEFTDFNVLYFGSYTGFKTETDINYYWHQIGLYQSTDTYSLGAYFEQRINKEANNYFDYLNYAAYYNQSFKFSGINLKSNISFNSMNYSNIPDFNNWILSAGLTGNKSFQTKTTFIGTVLMNYKGFKNYTEYSDTLRNPDYVWYNSENVNILQIDLNTRFAQSLGENTGLAVNLNYKKILSGSGFSASLFESTYGDVELYDDPISQEGLSYGGMLTQVFPSQVIFRLSYFFYNKDYPSQGVYHSETEYDDTIFRKDTQGVISGSLSKSFITNEETGNKIDLNLNFYLINNKSNSYYFNYNSNAVSASLNYSF